MEIYGVGTDIIEVERVARAIEGTASFVERVFTAGEIEYCQGKDKQSGQSFAARFAAKEAVAKSLKTGLGSELSWLDIEVIGSPPCISLKGKGALLARRLKVDRIEISISAVQDYAVAFAIALKQ